MKFFKELFCIQAKRMLRLPYFICLLILPMILLVTSYYMRGEETENISLGINYEEGPRKDKIVEWVMQNSDFEFQIYNNQEEMIEDVAQKKIQAGYFLSPELENGVWQKSIQVYSNEDYISGSMLGEVLIAGVMQSLSGDLGAQALSPYLPSTKEEISADIFKRAYQYTEHGSLIQTNFYAEGSTSTSTAHTKGSNVSLLLHAILSVSIMLLILFQNQQLIEDQKKGVLSLLDSSARKRYFFSYVIAGAFFAFLCALLSMGVLAITQRNNQFISWKEILLMLAFVLSIETFSQWLTQILPTSTQYFFSILILFFISILFGIRLFPMQNFVPGVWMLQYISPIYYYQAGISGAINFGVALSILCGSSIIFSLINSVRILKS